MNLIYDILHALTVSQEASEEYAADCVAHEDNDEASCARAAARAYEDAIRIVRGYLPKTEELQYKIEKYLDTHCSSRCLDDEADLRATALKMKAFILCGDWYDAK